MLVPERTSPAGRVLPSPRFDPDSMPTVTVVVPTYNRADLIADTLRSIEAQTFTDWECVVVDDGSTDDTAAVVQAFCERDARFRYVRQENSGASAARNRGIDAARGRYIAFVDSDDQFTPDRLAWQVEAMENDPDASLVYGDTWQYRAGDLDDGFLYIGDVPDKPSGWAFEALLQQCSIYAPLVRTGVTRELGGFDTEIPYAEDWDMWLSLARRGKLLYRPQIALHYRIHEGNRSGAAYREYSCGWQVVRKQTRGMSWTRRARLYMGVRRYFRQGYTGRLLQDMMHRGRGGDWKGACRVGWAVIALNAERPGFLLGLAWAGLRSRLRKGAREQASLQHPDGSGPGK